MESEVIMDSTLLERLDRIKMPAHQLADAKAQAHKAQAFVNFVFGLHEHNKSRGRRVRRYVNSIGRHLRRGYHPA
jgi:hypothetical protein